MHIEGERLEELAGEMGEGRLLGIDSKSNKYCARRRHSSSTFLFIRVKQIKVVAADRRNGSNMLNRTKIYICTYIIYTYI